MKKFGYQEILSKEEAEDKFIKAIQKCVEHWSNADEISRKQALDGLAFSILVIIDGESADHPSCVLRPLISTVDGDDWLDGGHDISGSLHDKYYQTYNQESKEKREDD